MSNDEQREAAQAEAEEFIESQYSGPDDDSRDENGQWDAGYRHGFTAGAEWQAAIRAPATPPAEPNS